MAYKAPVWEDGNSPAISAANLNDISQTLEGAQVLCGNNPPTSATEGAVGQFYLVVIADSLGNYPLYQCVGVSSTTYYWKLFEFASKYVTAAVSNLLGLSANATVEDALLALGTPYAGQGILRVSCMDTSGNPVSGCIVQVGGVSGVSPDNGVLAFNLDSGAYSVSVRSPIDYGMNSKTYSVTVPINGSIVLNATIEDSTGGTQELRITSSVAAAMFSNRVTSADVFCVGGGGSGGAGRAYPSNERTTIGIGGAGGYTKMASGISLKLPLTLTIGSGGAAVATGTTQTTGRNGNAGGTTTVKDSLGNIILSASGGSGGPYSASRGYGGAAGGSGSGAVRVISTAIYAEKSGQDGASGTASNNYAGGAGQGSTTRLWHQPTGELFASAGGSAIASEYYYGNATGTPGTGGGTAVAASTSSSIEPAGSGSTYGSGGGGIAILSGSTSDSYSSGAGMQGLIVFRWEVSA